MTGKFKKGDLVKVISSTHAPTDITRFMIGQVCEVKELWGDCYAVYTQDKSNFYFFKEGDLEELKEEKTMDDLQVGDILVNEYSNQRKVLGICGLVYFLSHPDILDEASYACYTIKELKKYFTLKIEEPTPTNMTLEEIEEALGKKINVVDSQE